MLRRDCFRLTKRRQGIGRLPVYQIVGRMPRTTARRSIFRIDVETLDARQIAGTGRSARRLGVEPRSLASTTEASPESPALLGRALILLGGKPIRASMAAR